MSKVKGAEEEEWKHAIDPLTQADLRGEEGEPQFSLSLSLSQTQQTKISHLMFLSTGLMLFIHAAKCEKINVNNKKTKKSIKSNHSSLCYYLTYYIFVTSNLCFLVMLGQGL